jgi:regulator of replication initiation timing
VLPTNSFGWAFLAAIEWETAEIGMENAIDLESLSSEFQFVELGRRVEEFISQHHHVEVVRLKSAIVDLQRRLAGHDREFCQLVEANRRARAEQNAQLECLRRGIEEVAKKQQDECRKVSRLQKAVGEVPPQMNEIEKVALGLVQTEGRISRVESNIGGLRAAMADGGAKVEEIRREVAGLKAQLSDCCPKVNMEQKLANLKGEINAMKEKQAPLVEEVGTLKEQLRQMAAKPGRQFPPSVKEGKLRSCLGHQTNKMDKIPDGIIAHLTRECGGNVHERGIVVTTASSVLKAAYAPMNAVDFTTEQVFTSDVMTKGSNVPHTRNNWITFDFKKRRVVPTHYAIRGCWHSNEVMGA